MSHRSRAVIPRVYVPDSRVRHGRRHRPADGADHRAHHRRASAAARQPLVGPAHALGHERPRKQPDADRSADGARRAPGPGHRPVQPLLHDGRQTAIVVAEARRALDFRSPHTMALQHALKVPQCPGVDHMDYTADGRDALVSCEFGGRMVVVDLEHERVVRTIPLRRSAMPQDVKLSPDGRTFYVADMASNGVWLIDAASWRVIRLQHTGRGAHGLYPSRDGRDLYVSNRGEGSISVLSFRTRRPIRQWRLPGGGSRTWAACRPTAGCYGSPAATTPSSTRSRRARAPAAPHPGRPRPARRCGVAAARPLLHRPHRHHALRARPQRCVPLAIDGLQRVARQARGAGGRRPTLSGSRSGRGPGPR